MAGSAAKQAAAKNLKSLLTDEPDVRGLHAEAVDTTYSSKKQIDAGAEAYLRGKARKRIKPIPDPESGKTARRKTTARARKKRGGRASTILSESTDTLG